MSSKRAFEVNAAENNVNTHLPPSVITKENTINPTSQINSALLRDIVSDNSRNKQISVSTQTDERYLCDASIQTENCIQHKSRIEVGIQTNIGGDDLASSCVTIRTGVNTEVQTAKDIVPVPNGSIRTGVNPEVQAVKDIVPVGLPNGITDATAPSITVPVLHETNHSITPSKACASILPKICSVIQDEIIDPVFPRNTRADTVLELKTAYAVLSGGTALALAGTDCPPSKSFQGSTERETHMALLVTANPISSAISHIVVEPSREAVVVGLKTRTPTEYSVTSQAFECSQSQLTSQAFECSQSQLSIYSPPYIVVRNHRRKSSDDFRGQKLALDEDGEGGEVRTERRELTTEVNVRRVNGNEDSVAVVCGSQQRDGYMTALDFLGQKISFSDEYMV